MNLNKIFSPYIKKYLLFHFSQLIIIKILFFVISFIRFKQLNILYFDINFEYFQLIYDIIINPVYLLIINIFFTLKQNKYFKIINLIMIIICIYIGLQLSFFSWKIIYFSDDWEHGMFYSLQIIIFIPIYFIIGIIEYIILNTILLKRQGK
jgi:hypothetical protein